MDNVLLITAKSFDRQKIFRLIHISKAQASHIIAQRIFGQSHHHASNVCYLDDKNYFKLAWRLVFPITSCSSTKPNNKTSNSVIQVSCCGNLSLNLNPGTQTLADTEIHITWKLCPLATGSQSQRHWQHHKQPWANQATSILHPDKLVFNHKTWMPSQLLYPIVTQSYKTVWWHN